MQTRRTMQEKSFTHKHAVQCKKTCTSKHAVQCKKTCTSKHAVQCKKTCTSIKLKCVYMERKKKWGTHPYESNHSQIMANKYHKV